MTKTKKKTLQIFVNALRSNKYKKATGRLKRGDRFCAFGVACDLYAKENEDFYWVKSQGNEFEFSDEKGIYHDIIPPNKVVNRLGISRAIRDYIIEMNDGKRSFKEIASYLEGKYLS